MLQAGYVFCHRCGHATQEAYYYNSELNVWVQLRRTLSGRLMVEHYTPQSLMGKVGAEEADQIDRFVLSVATERPKEGLPHTIQVDCYADNGMATKKFNRSCPFCIGKLKSESESSVQELISGMGNLPTYVIGVIGARTVGKSCWIHALSCPVNIRIVNSQRDGGAGYEGYILTGTSFTEDSSVPPEATPINALGNTRIMTICRKRGQNTVKVAQVLVLDFAGELFARNKAQEFNDTTAHIFKGGVGYSGVDAVVFMMAPSELEPYRDTREADKNRDQYSLANTYNRVNGDLNLLSKKPIAFVLNKVDILFDNPPMAYINNDRTAPKVPLLSKYTFANQGMAMYQKRALLPRVALQTELLKKMSSLVDAASLQTSCAGFLVKATAPVFGENGEIKYVDFTDSINVLDPLLWILNKLDIFPIDDKTN